MSVTLAMEVVVELERATDLHGPMHGPHKESVKMLLSIVDYLEAQKCVF